MIRTKILRSCSTQVNNCMNVLVIIIGMYYYNRSREHAD